MSRNRTKEKARDGGVEGVAWEDLATLLAGLEHRSLNRAAAALHIGQSTASRRIARLEGRLGARLFDRLPDGLAPTQFALELASHARLIEGHMADIERLAFSQDSSPTGKVRLAVPDGFASSWLVHELSSFFAAYPGVEVDLVIGHAVVDLVRRDADMALRFVAPKIPDLIVEPLGTLPMGVYARPELADTPARDLRWVTFIDPQGLYLETTWLHEQVRPERTLQVSLWGALFSAVCAGLGAGLVSPVVAEPAGLVPLSAKLPPVPGRDIYLVHHRALRDVPRIRALRSWLIERVNTFLNEC